MAASAHRIRRPSGVRRRWLQMARIRLIARLDIKAPNLIKGVQFEGLRKLGDPNEFAKRYYDAGIDEIIYMDIVASLYQRNSLLDIVSRTCRDIFVPLTVGGGIRSLDDAKAVLRAGADKVAVNTAAIANPSLITDIARRFGSQCMVVSIEAKCRPGGGWEAFTDNGREHTGRDAVVWAKEAEQRGAGELLVTRAQRQALRRLDKPLGAIRIGLKIHLLFSTRPRIPKRCDGL